MINFLPSNCQLSLANSCDEIAFMSKFQHNLLKLNYPRVPRIFVIT